MRFTNHAILRMQQRGIDEGFLVDIDDAGRIYGIEIVGVSERMSVASLGKINIDMPLAEAPA